MITGIEGMALFSITLVEQREQDINPKNKVKT